MTIQENLETELVNRGLWPNEAKAVLVEMKADKSQESMNHRWNDDVSEYPPQLATMLLLSAKRFALKWIDANAPQHWARGLLQYRMDGR